MAATVLVEDVDDVRHVTLRRPPVNALSLTEYDALAAAFDVAAGARVLLLRAEGDVWCAGQDLRELQALTRAEDRAAHLRRASRAVAAAARCPVPVVCALDGPAVGAGALLVACADVVLGTPRASLALPEVRLGLRLGRSLLTDVLPAPVVTYALATGATLDASRLHQLGLLAEVVPPEALPARAAAVVADLVGLEDDSLRWLRRQPHRHRSAAAYLEEIARATAPASASPASWPEPESR